MALCRLYKVLRLVSAVLEVGRPRAERGARKGRSYFGRECMALRCEEKTGGEALNGEEGAEEHTA